VIKKENEKEKKFFNEELEKQKEEIKKQDEEIEILKQLKEKKTANSDEENYNKLFIFYFLFQFLA
jgi:TorA maturation chaperone TorD